MILTGARPLQCLGKGEASRWRHLQGGEGGHEAGPGGAEVAALGRQQPPHQALPRRRRQAAWRRRVRAVLLAAALQRAVRKQSQRSAQRVLLDAQMALSWKTHVGLIQRGAHLGWDYNIRIV